jgi:uncharacterized protein (DUF433 family)
LALDLALAPVLDSPIMGDMASPISKNANVMHGQPCFSGTRVLVQTLFDHLEAGYSIDEFLTQFPTVKREQITQLFCILRDDVQRRGEPVTA